MSAWGLLQFVTTLTLAAVLSDATKAEARFPWGGWVSRDFTLVEKDPLGDAGETLWAVSMENGENEGNMTLWSFCTGTEAGTPCTQAEPSDTICTAPCKARVETGSDDQQLYSSPGASNDGDWVMFGTKDQALHSVFWTGSNWILSRWSAYEVAELRCRATPTANNCNPIKPKNDEKKLFANGFHARPVYLEWTETVGNDLITHKIFVAVNRGNNNEAYLHTMMIDPLTHELKQWADPKRIENASEFLLDPFPDTIGALPRVYIAANDNDGNTPSPVRAFSFAKADCQDNPNPADPPPCQEWHGPWVTSPNDPVEKGPNGARLGAVIAHDTLLKNGERADLLIYNRKHGPLAMRLDSGNEGKREWETYIKQIHRTKPTLSTTGRDPSPTLEQNGSHNPVLYLGQRQGGKCKGKQARVYRLDAGTGLPANPAEDSLPDSACLRSGNETCEGEGENEGYVDGENQPRPMFPRCYDEKIGNASFSSPMVNPISGHIFFGPAHPGDPIYKVDPRNPQRSWKLDGNQPDDGNLLHNYSRVGWFDYAPTNGWRTNAAFSDDGKTMFIGSAGGIVYALDADEPCGVVRWCFDTRGESADDPPKLNGGYCTAANRGTIPCCDDLADEDAPATRNYRRTAKICDSCWNAKNELITCEETLVWDGHTFEGHTAPDSVRQPVIIAFPAYTTATQEDGLVVENCASPQGYDVTFRLDHSGTPAYGEAMNETSGVVVDTENVEIDGTSMTEATVNVRPGLPNEIRFALFDQHANESIVRVRLENVSAPACN